MNKLALSGMRVLVLEDEYLIAMDVEQLCHDLGAAHVSIARRLSHLPGDEGRRPFEFAVVDVSVGGEPTLAFAGELAQSGVPFVFATGYAKTDSQFVSFPSTPILTKPYAADAFGTAVRDALGQSPAYAALDPNTCDEMASGP